MLEIGYTQHMGKVHRSQQDALWNGEQCIQDANHPASARFSALPALFAIADGLTISPSPQAASRFAVEQLANLVPEFGLTSKTIRVLHGDLCNRYARGKTFGSSTTLVAAFLSDEAASVVNVGDSRAYLIDRQGLWKMVTRDHTVLNELIDSKLADPAEQYASLYRALSDCLVADHEEDRFAINQTKIPLHHGDSLLLCSDGVHDTLGDTSLKALFDQARSPHEQVEVWRKAILKAGAPDNFSMILIRSLEDCNT